MYFEDGEQYYAVHLIPTFEALIAERATSKIHLIDFDMDRD